MTRSVLAFLAFLLGSLQVAAPETSISGRVRDFSTAPNGAITRVIIGTVGYRDGRRIFQQTNATQLDALGYYRVSGLQAGEYYIRADIAPLGGASTFYPGTPDIETATRIAVEAGQKVVGVDFDLKRGPMFKVSGNVLNFPADNSILGMTFVSGDSRRTDTTSAPLVSSPSTNGRFEISLPPGLWDVFPVIPVRRATPPGTTTTTVLPPATNVPTYATGRARVLVVDRDVEKVVVTIGSADIKGRLVVAGSAQTENITSMRIGLLAKDNYPSPLLSHLRTQREIGSTGEFSFLGVPPGRYALQFGQLPSGLYISDVRIGSKSIYDDGIITVGTEPIDPVEVVLSRDGGQVRVMPSGDPGSGSPRTIVLVPSAPRRENAALYKRGGELIRDVAPGRYKVFAFQDLPPGGAEQNAEFIATYEHSGVTIDVTAGQTIDVKVEWIPVK